MNYSFRPAPACNMCGSESRKILGRRLNTSQGLRPKSRIGISVTVVRCTACGLIYSDPLPIPQSIEDHYGIDPEKYWKPEYFEPTPDHRESEFVRFRRLVPNAKTLLDIGTGIGIGTIAALNAGYDAHAIEGSGTFHKVAAEKLGGRVTHTMLEDAEFLEETFDIISFGAVLEHIYDPAESLEKVMPWLKPNGIIHVNVPSSDYLFSKIFNLYFWLARTDYVVNISPMHPPFHLYEFTERSFKAHGEKAGYSIAHTDRFAGGSVINGTGPIVKALAPVMNATDTGMQLIVYLRKSHPLHSL